MPARSRRRVAVLVVVLAALLLVWLGQRPRPTPELPRPRVARGERIRPSPSAPYVAPAEVDETAEDGPRPFRAEPWRLANGMTVIVVRDPSAPTIAARIVVRAGAADDPPGLAGLAHLVEHLMFAGTSRLGTADFAREAPHLDELRALTSELAATTDPVAREELEAAVVAAHEAADVHGLPNEVHRLLDELGATGANASTGVEQTVYGALLPASALEPWAALEAERFSDPVFRSFVNERRVVEEELALRTDCAGGRRAEDERAVLFGDHPFAAPIGGTPASLARVSLADAEAFFDRWYVPENMAVVLVGAIDLSTARRVLDDTLGRIPAAPAPARRSPRIEEHRGIVRLEDEGDAEAAFLVRDLVPGDLEALRVASGALGSELFERGSGRLWGARVTIERFTDAAIVRITGRCERTEQEACLRRIRDAVATVGRGGSWRQELATARVWAWIERLEELERQDVQADQLARAWARGESPAELWAGLTRLRDLDLGRVSETLARLLSPDHLVHVRGDGRWTRTESARSVAARTEVDDPRMSSLYREIVAIPQPEQPSGWRVEGRDFTRSGDRVVAVVNPSNPLFRAELRWPRGVRDDPDLCRALGAWLTPTAGDWTKRLHRVGVRVEDRFRPSCGWDSLGLVLRGPGSEAATSLRAVFDALRAPTVRDESPFSAAGHTALRRRLPVARAIFGAAVPPMDEEPPASAALAAALRVLATIPPDVRYMGPHSAAEVAAMVPAGPRTETPLAPIQAARRTIQVWPSVRTRTAVVVRAGEPYDPDREPIYALYEHWLGGPAGVADEEVRTALGEAYQIEARYVRGARPGLPNVTEVRVTTKTGDPVETARLLVDVFATPAVDEVRWARVRDATEVHAWADVTPFRAAAGPLADAFARGLDGDPAEAAWAGLGDVTKERFDAFLAAEAATPHTLVVTGADADDPRLSALGPVEERP